MNMNLETAIKVARLLHSLKGFNECLLMDQRAMRYDRDYRMRSINPLGERLYTAVLGQLDKKYLEGHLFSSYWDGAEFRDVCDTDCVTVVSEVADREEYNSHCFTWGRIWGPNPYEYGLERVLGFDPTRITVAYNFLLVMESSFSEEKDRDERFEKRIMELYELWKESGDDALYQEMNADEVFYIERDDVEIGAGLLSGILFLYYYFGGKDWDDAPEELAQSLDEVYYDSVVNFFEDCFDPDFVVAEKPLWLTRLFMDTILGDNGQVEMETTYIYWFASCEMKRFREDPQAAAYPYFEELNAICGFLENPFGCNGECFVFREYTADCFVCAIEALPGSVTSSYFLNIAKAAFTVLYDDYLAQSSVCA